MPMPPTSTQHGLLTALHCKHMPSPTGTNGPEVCRRGHCVAMMVLSVVFSSLRPVRVDQIFRMVRSGRIPKCDEGSGKALGKPVKKTVEVFCLFF